MIAGGAVVIGLIAVGLALRHGAFEKHVESATATSPALPASAPPAAYQGFLYGRVKTIGGAIYEGRLRCGGNQEAFWSDYFNGSKDENRWVAHVPPERLPKERRPIEIFGIEIAEREGPVDLSRPFVTRFGDITRVEASVDDVRVTLKSGTVFELDRQGASDFDDGLRVWDRRKGVVDLDNLVIRTIDLFPGASPGAVPARLHGTVRTRQGEFSGFVQWNRQECVGSDALDGRSSDGELSLRFDTIRSIARHSRDSALVTLLDGREIVLSGSREVGHRGRGMYVDDRRFGRALISWDAFERVDFGAAGSGPAYGEFAPGHPVTGSVTTRTGRRLAGRLVYDLDESETTETLEAPFDGVYYTIPFGMIASIALPEGEAGGGRHAKVTLHNGEELQLERTGDLGERNAGMLVFVDGGQRRPEYVPWNDVQKIHFDRTGSQAMPKPFPLPLSVLLPAYNPHG